MGHLWSLADRETPPPFPTFDIATLPIDHVSKPRLMMEEANWFQNLEGDIDSVHIDYLHSRLDPDKPMAGGIRGFYTRDRAPKFDVAETDYGAFYSARRQWDDDGNEGVRINYVMEFGNYGYKDEVTGAGWKTPRTNLEKEIPLQHWHLNDPGVVPNLLQTGAGSPTAKPASSAVPRSIASLRTLRSRASRRLALISRR